MRKTGLKRSQRLTASHRGKKKPKEKSITKLMREADVLFSKQVRMKGAWLVGEEWWNKCYTSGYEAPIRKLHCGHYLSRYYKAARWDFDNSRPQSLMANMWMRGDPIKFRQNLLKEIGPKRVKAVEAKRDQPTKLTKEYLQALIKELSL